MKYLKKGRCKRIINKLCQLTVHVPANSFTYVEYITIHSHLWLYTTLWENNVSNFRLKNLTKIPISVGLLYGRKEHTDSLHFVLWRDFKSCLKWKSPSECIISQTYLGYLSNSKTLSGKNLYSATVGNFPLSNVTNPYCIRTLNAFFT